MHRSGTPRRTGSRIFGRCLGASLRGARAACRAVLVGAARRARLHLAAEVAVPPCPASLAPGWLPGVLRLPHEPVVRSLLGGAQALGRIFDLSRTMARLMYAYIDGDAELLERVFRSADHNAAHVHPLCRSAAHSLPPLAFAGASPPQSLPGRTRAALAGRARDHRARRDAETQEMNEIADVTTCLWQSARRCLSQSML